EIERAPARDQVRIVAQMQRQRRPAGPGIGPIGRVFGPALFGEPGDEPALRRGAIELYVGPEGQGLGQKPAADEVFRRAHSGIWQASTQREPHNSASRARSSLTEAWVSPPAGITRS